MAANTAASDMPFWSVIVNKLITILGPTAVGKTALSFSLAEAFHSDLVSGDAYQIYRYMDIGTAKPSAKELAAYHHYLIDIANPNEEFSTVLFRDKAIEAISEIQNKGKIPILVGGTGLYVQSLLEGYQFNAPKSDEEIRNKARDFIAARSENELKDFILTSLHWEPADWHELFRNTHRLIRLISAIMTGNGNAYIKSGKAEDLVYDSYVIGLMLPREVLYERINLRVDTMLAAGWIDEVKSLLEHGITINDQAMKAIGYQEIAAYLNGSMALAGVAEAIKIRTRHFAKRQIAWYKRMPYINWYNKNEFADEQALAKQIILDIKSKWNNK